MVLVMESAATSRSFLKLRLEPEPAGGKKKKKAQSGSNLTNSCDSVTTGYRKV